MEHINVGFLSILPPIIAIVLALKSKDVVDELVKKGELTVEQGKALNEELKHNFAKKTEKSVDQISKDLENINPEDLEILKQKITELQNTKHETE